MKSAKSQLWMLKPFGFLFIVLGLFGIFLDLFQRAHHSYPLDLGIVLGNIGFIGSGTFAVITSRCLKDLVERLDKIENVR